MPAPEILHQLVAKFEENRAAYRSGKYNEAQRRSRSSSPTTRSTPIYQLYGLADEEIQIVKGSK